MVGVMIINFTDAGAGCLCLFNLQDRGEMFVGAQVEVYQGMIVGEHNRENDSKSMC